MMRGFAFVFLFFISLDSFAALSPRMYSVILQGAATARLTSDPSKNSIYSSKADFNLMYFGRIGSGGPTLGFHYLAESRNDVEFETGKSYGLSLGYYWNSGWFILGHYDFFAELGPLTDGHGPQIDFGYLEHLGGHFHIGLQVSHRSTNYDTARIQETYPSLTLMHLF